MFMKSITKLFRTRFSALNNNKDIKKITKISSFRECSVPGEKESIIQINGIKI